MRKEDESVTPEFSEVVQVLIDATLVSLNVCLPAKIVTYNPATQYADVQIQLLQKYEDGTLKKRPTIPNVPVVHPRANNGAAFIHIPLVPGDDVMLVFSQRSLDNWKAQGGMQDPNDRRKFHITDAVAIPGGSSIAHAFKPTTTDSIEIVNGQTQVIIRPDGKIAVKNEENELIDLLDKITEQVRLTDETLSTDRVNTWLGPQQLIAFQTYADIATELQSLKQKLETFKI